MPGWERAAQTVEAAQAKPESTWLCTVSSTKLHARKISSKVHVWTLCGLWLSKDQIKPGAVPMNLPRCKKCCQSLHIQPGFGPI